MTENYITDREAYLDELLGEISEDNQHSEEPIVIHASVDYLEKTLIATKEELYTLRQNVAELDMDNERHRERLAVIQGILNLVHPDLEFKLELIQKVLKI